MHLQEAIWINQIINKNQKNIKKLLNVGSSTKEFRKILQPHIDKYIFKNLRDKEVEVLHLDYKKDDGVDIQCDILNREEVINISKQNFDTVICSNLLEHVEDIKLTCDNLSKILKPNGLMILTVPYFYPKHNDPIDNLFRPSPEQLSSFFPKFIKIEEKILDIKPIFFMKSKFQILKSLVRLLIPFFNLKGYETNFWSIIWMFKQRKVTCLLLKKEN